jgi:uncharacterized membrane protein
MYKIIGADQKEYGPVTGDQIRQWIAENRVNPQTQARAEGTQEWKLLSAFPEFAELLGGSGTTPPPLFASPTMAPFVPEELLAQDYSLDIGSCLTRSWELLKKNFWPMVGISFLVMLAIGGINQLFGLFSKSAMNAMVVDHRFEPRDIFMVLSVSILSAPIYSVFMGGLFKYYLKLIRGESAGIADAFSGFSPSIGQLLVLGLVQCLLVDLGLVLCFLPGFYLAIAWYFSVALVIDRQLDFWPAMELSRKMVSKHWFVVFGCILVMGLVAGAGVLACCVGVFATMTLGMGALMYAYEDIFSRRTS